jgi:copper(I)-binding protein
MRNTLGIAFGAVMLHGYAVAIAGGALTIEDPYAWAVAPGQSNSAAFMRIVNRGDIARAVVSGTSTAAEVVELHSHTMEGGTMKMRRVERVEIPAKGAVSLEPGGMHLMLIGLKRGLVPGETVDVTLALDDGAGIEVQAEVRSVLPADPHLR